MAASEEVRKKGLQIYADGRVKKTLDTHKRTHFSVTGDTEEHSVIFDKEKNIWMCDCKYYALRGKACSHTTAAQLMMKNEK